MAKRFSIVTVNKDEEVFLRGFAEPIDLSNSALFLEIMSEFSSFEKVSIEIEHCLLLDFPGNDEDISIEDLETVLEDFDDLLAGDYLFSEAVLSFEMYGIKEDDIVES